MTAARSGASKREGLLNCPGAGLHERKLPSWLPRTASLSTQEFRQPRIRALSSAELTSHDSLPHAVLFAAGAALALPLMDGLVKALVPFYPVVMIAWWRFAVMSALLVTLGMPSRGWRQFKSQAPLLQGVRAALMVVATASFYTGLNRLPLAECTAIMFLAPALSALFARIWLHERPGHWGWLAIALSVTGVFVIVRPGGRMFDPAALYVLAGTLAYAVFSLITRLLAARDAAHVTTLWSALGSLAAFSVLLPSAWLPITDLRHLSLLLCIGALGAFGQLLFSRAYRHGRTHVIAPITYLSLPVALTVGWYGFDEVPDLWSIVGIAIIAGSAFAVASGRTTRP